MANEFKIKHGFISTGSGSVEGELRITGASYADNGSRIATRPWVTQFLSDNSYATAGDITTAISNLVDSAPGTLDTLNELAAAIGDDPNFAISISTSIASKLPLAGGTMTGNITFTDNAEGIVWSRNTDGASIKFYNTADGDTDSRLEFHTNDNNNEYFRWTHGPSGGALYEVMKLMPTEAGGSRLTVQGEVFEGSERVATQTHVSSNYLSKFHDMTITLTGDASGTGTFNNMGDVSFAVTVANDSHTHDGRYYTETEIDTFLGDKAAKVHTHDAADIVSGTFPSERLSGVYTIDVSGTSTYANNLYRDDNRTIAPSGDTNGTLSFGFTSFQNDNSAPWADYLHLRSYTDSSGGRDNLLMFSKSDMEIRLWQQDFNSADNYADFRDIAFKDELQVPAIKSNGSTPSLNTGITAGEIRTLIGAGTSSFDGAYSSLSGLPTLGTAAASAATDFVAVSGDTMTGTLTASGGINGLTLANGISGTNFNITGVNQLEIADPGEGIVFKSGSSGDMTLAIVDDTSDNILRFSGTGATLQVGTNTVYHTGNLNIGTLDGYTQGEVDNLVDAKADLSHTHTFASLTSKPDFINNSLLSSRATGTPDTVGDSYGVSVNYMQDGATNSPSGVDHALLTMSYSNLWQTQLAQDWRENGRIYIRGQENGTWSGWGQVWSSHDFTSTSISNWNTAYGWGNHASAGYLTSLPNHNHDTLYDAIGSADAVGQQINERIDTEVFDAITSAQDTADAALPKSGGTLYKQTNTSGTSGTTFLTVHNNVGGDISQQQSFVDFMFTDTNANFTPQVRIGAQVGRNADANAISKEGAGAFVVYTGDGTDESGGGALSEAMRIGFDNKLYVQGEIQASGYNKTNWDTAYGWGNHASAGYLTTLPSHNHDTLYDSLGSADAVATALNERIDTEVFDAITTVNGNIPTNNNQLTNGAGYITSFDITTQTDGKYLRSNADDSFSGNLTSAQSKWIKFYHPTQTDSNDGKIGAGVFDTGLNIVGVQTVAGTGRQVRVWGDLITSTGAKYATESYVSTAVSNLVDSAPAALNTLNELAAALGDDANFSTTVANNIGAIDTRINDEVIPYITDVETTANAALPQSGGTITGSLTIGAAVTLSESTDRSDLLYINSSTSSWGGLQIGNTSNEFIFSLMGNGNAGGIYDDQNGDWIIYWDENAGVILHHNTNEKLRTVSDGVNVTGRLYASDGIQVPYAAGAHKPMIVLNGATNYGLFHTEATNDKFTFDFNGDQKFQFSQDGIFTINGNTITTGKVTNWDTAYAWGDHSGLYDGVGSASTAEANAIAHVDERIDNEVLPQIQTPAITSNGTVPALNSGISAAEVRSLIGAGTSSSDTNYYLSGASFNTSDGVLTLTVSGAANQGVDLDGRYLPLSGGSVSGNIIMTNTNPMISFVPSGTNDAAGIRFNYTNNDGVMEFWTSDDYSEPFVWRAYDIGLVGTGTYQEWMKLESGNLNISGNFTAAGNLTTNQINIQSITSDGTIANDKGSYLHLGGWAVGRTDATAVLVNTAYRADILNSSRTFTIGNTGKNFNGSANVSWTLAEIGAESAGAAASVNDRIDNEIVPALATIPTDNSQLTNGAGYITSADGGNAQTLDGLDSSAFVRKGVGYMWTATGSNALSFRSQNTIESSSGDQAALEVFQDNAGEDAFMQFHVSSDYAVYFGLDGSTNDLAVGGWSMGANKYRIWHAGNDGSGSGLDADTVDGVHESTFMRRSANSHLDMNNYNITEVNHITFNDSGFGEGIQWQNWLISDSPDDLSNGAGNLQISSTAAPEIRVTVDTNGNLYPSRDRQHFLGLETNRWQIVFCEILDSAGQHEKNLQNPEGEKSVGEYPTGTVLVWKGGKNVPCVEYADHMRMGIAVKGIDSPLIQGAEPVLVTGVVKEGDYLITSRKEGHAEAISPELMRQQGLYDCVLGKALENGEGESYLVKTWINI